MPGPVPGIHVFLRLRRKQVVDGRNKSGHDGNVVFQSSLPDLIRQSMLRTGSLSLSVRPHSPDVSMDHRLKPGGDEVRRVGYILDVEYRVATPFS